MQRPSIEAPKDLAAWRFDVEGDAFALLEWPCSRAELPAGWRLTRAEAAVAMLAASGRSNSDIARERRCSPRTVANQMARAFRKLGVRSRAELAATLASRRHGAEP